MTANPLWYLVVLWISWWLQFLVFRPKEKRTPVKIAPNARWGIMLQAIGYWAIFSPSGRSLTDPIPPWRLLTGAAFGLLGIYLAGAGLRHLGKQWRVNAALNADHELITSGPYRFVRHPIYASMFAMIVMSAVMVGRLPWWPVGVALFIAGLEIRVQVEDRLLKNHFGSRFEEWKARVPAYFPPFR